MTGEELQQLVAQGPQLPKWAADVFNYLRPLAPEERRRLANWRERSFSEPSITQRPSDIPPELSDVLDDIVRLTIGDFEPGMPGQRKLEMIFPVVVGAIDPEVLPLVKNLLNGILVKGVPAMNKQLFDRMLSYYALSKRKPPAEVKDEFVNKIVDLAKNWSSGKAGNFISPKAAVDWIVQKTKEAPKEVAKKIESVQPRLPLNIPNDKKTFDLVPLAWDTKAGGFEGLLRSMSPKSQATWFKNYFNKAGLPEDVLGELLRLIEEGSGRFFSTREVKNDAMRKLGARSLDEFLKFLEEAPSKYGIRYVRIPYADPEHYSGVAAELTNPGGAIKKLSSILDEYFGSGEQAGKGFVRYDLTRSKKLTPRDLDEIANNILRSAKTGVSETELGLEHYYQPKLPFMVERKSPVGAPLTGFDRAVLKQYKTSRDLSNLGDLYGFERLRLSGEPSTMQEIQEQAMEQLDPADVYEMIGRLTDAVAGTKLEGAAADVMNSRNLLDPDDAREALMDLISVVGDEPTSVFAAVGSGSGRSVIDMPLEDLMRLKPKSQVNPLARKVSIVPPEGKPLAPQRPIHPDTEAAIQFSLLPQKSSQSSRILEILARYLGNKR